MYPIEWKLIKSRTDGRPDVVSYEALELLLLNTIIRGESLSPRVEGSVQFAWNMVDRMPLFLKEIEDLILSDVAAGN